MNLSRPLATVVILSCFALAQGTRTWEQSRFDDLSKGTAKGISLRSTGGIELAPAFKPLFVTPSTYIWSLASDDSGTVYAAAGSPARVYRITPDGQSSVIFEPRELQVQAVVFRGGSLYAATSPDGKVYKIDYQASTKADANSDTKSTTDPSWKSSVFFEPGTKYIWDLEFDSAGNLYVATGDQGQIFKVTVKGEHSVFFKSDETHIRSLAMDAKGNVIAGSDSSGLVYRITPAGEAFVLYSAAKKEITALALDAAGNIYAAAVGEKHPGTQNPQPGTAPFSGVGPVISPVQPGTGNITMLPTQPGSFSAFSFPGTNASGGSEVYRIAPDGAPLKLWTSREDIVYALAFDSAGRILAATGNRGRIFAINRDGTYNDLLKATATQATAFTKAPDGGLYVATSNLGKIFLLGPAPETEGTFDSDIFDARGFSRWGHTESRSTGSVDLFTRSGNVDNPDRNWSAWQRVDAGLNGASSPPAARFLQWRAVLRSGTAAPQLESVLVNYLPRNVAPEIDDVTIQLNTRYPSIPKQPGQDITLSTSSSNAPPPPRFEAPVPTIHDPDSIGIKWSAHDDNDDQLTYSVYYRGDGESRWLLFKNNLTDKFYSFEATLLPDDGYAVKVVASDAPSHSPGEALTSEKISMRFEVDTAPPRIDGLNATLDAGQLHITFHAADNLSPIKHAEYSVDAADWQFIEPTGQLSDAKSEAYDFRAMIAPEPTPGAAQSKKESSVEHVVAVRVYDRYDNFSSAKTVVRGDARGDARGNVRGK